MHKKRWLTILAVLALAFSGCSKEPDQQTKPEETPKQAEQAPQKAPQKILFVNTKFKDEVSKSYTAIAKAVNSIQPEVVVEIIHYSKVNPEFVKQFGPAAMLLGPQGTPWWEYDQEKLEAAREAVRQYEGPILGICGGHQFLSVTYGGQVGPMQCAPDHKGYEGCVKEFGYTPVLKKKEDPFLADLPEEMVVTENHYECVQKMPEGFEILAGTDMCPVQAIRMKDRPVYGVQFHPERHDDDNPHGRTILTNWLKLADLL